MPEIEPEFLREVRTMYPEFDIRPKGESMEKWALILLLKMLSSLMQGVPVFRAKLNHPELQEAWSQELSAMLDLLKGDKTMIEFAQDYPEYTKWSEVRYEERSPDGGD